MAARAVHRGPDRQGIWADGAIGFINATMWGTPESPFEALPFTRSASGLTITADARVDNRKELATKLGVPSQAQETMGDGELILLAYEKWGESCVEYLVGDFAFAIWDTRRQILFLARDHFGTKPLCYYRSHALFAFSSEIGALLALKEVPSSLNEARIADFLVPQLETINNSCTFYRDILRVEPATTMTVSLRGTQSRPYWFLDNAKELSYSSDDDYVEAFSELFTESVRCRLRGMTPAASMLSGGLDSSAIVGVAHRVLSAENAGHLRTFSRIASDTINCDETRSVRTMLTALPELDHHAVSPSQFDRFVSDVDRIVHHTDDPFDIFLLDARLVMYSEASRLGVKALLDGVDADIVTSNREKYLEFLLRDGSWRTAVAEARGFSYYYADGPSSWRLLYGHARAAFVPAPLKRIKRSVSSLRPMRATTGPLIDQEFARAVNLADRLEENRRNRNPQPSKTLREYQHDTLRAPLVTVALERYDRVAAAFSIEARHPFLDKRLAEFCLAVPWQQTIKNGWPKSLLRRSMKGILPEEVRMNRKIVGSQEATLADLWLARNRDLLKELTPDGAPEVSRFVNISAISEAHKRYFVGRSEEGKEILWRAGILARWLGRDQRVMAARPTN